MEKIIWLSYDFGIRGDYESMYAWLDTHDAKECGDSIAVLKFDYSYDFLKELTESMASVINIKDSNRIYIIYYDDNLKKVRGKFLFGRRKVSPWTGYAVKYVEDLEDA
jgi:hypothetical protein